MSETPEESNTLEQRIEAGEFDPIINAALDANLRGLSDEARGAKFMEILDNLGQFAVQNIVAQLTAVAAVSSDDFQKLLCRIQQLLIAKMPPELAESVELMMARFGGAAAGTADIGRTVRVDVDPARLPDWEDVAF